MARRIFIELTALGEGPDDSARRVPKASLVCLPSGGAEEVLQVLTDERLVITGAEGDREVVSIAHEALIRDRNEPTDRVGNVGFRCVGELP